MSQTRESAEKESRWLPPSRSGEWTSVTEIRANRDAVARRDSLADHVYAARRFLRRYDRSRI